MIKLNQFVSTKKKLRECADCEDDNSQDWTHGHDHEGFMAKSEIKDLIKHAVQLHNMLGSNDQLPGWVSAYITLASDYIHSVTEHLAGKADEMGDMPDQMMAEDKKNTHDIVLNFDNQKYVDRVKSTPVFGKMLAPNQMKALKVGDNDLTVNNVALNGLERMESMGLYNLTRKSSALAETKSK